MDLYQHFLYYLKMYSDISIYITHIYCDYQEKIIYISVVQLRDDCFMIKYDTIQLTLCHGPDRYKNT
jgi:hypothetical protein